MTNAIEGTVVCCLKIFVLDICDDMIVYYLAASQAQAQG